MGCGYAITELLSAEAISRNNKKTLDMLNGIEKLNIPVAVQIFGSKPDVMALAAKKLKEDRKIYLLNTKTNSKLLADYCYLNANTFLFLLVQIQNNNRN